MVYTVFARNQWEWDLSTLFDGLQNQYHIDIPNSQRRMMADSHGTLSYGLRAVENKNGKIRILVNIIGATTTRFGEQNKPPKKRVRQNVTRLIATINNFKKHK